MNSHRVYHNTARYLANTRGTHTHTHIGWVAMRRAPHITIIHILLDTRGALVISYRISKIITDVAASLRGRFRASAGRVCVCVACGNRIQATWSPLAYLCVHANPTQYVHQSD